MNSPTSPPHPRPDAYMYTPTNARSPPYDSHSAPTHPPTPVNCPGTRTLTRQPAPLLVERALPEAIGAVPVPRPDPAPPVASRSTPPRSSLPDRQMPAAPAMHPLTQSPTRTKSHLHRSRCGPYDPNIRTPQSRCSVIAPLTPHGATRHPTVRSPSRHAIATTYGLTRQ